MDDKEKALTDAIYEFLRSDLEPIWAKFLEHQRRIEDEILTFGGLPLSVLKPESETVAIKNVTIPIPDPNAPIEAEYRILPPRELGDGR